jgi:hypothetical protein
MNDKKETPSAKHPKNTTDIHQKNPPNINPRIGVMIPYFVKLGNRILIASRNKKVIACLLETTV